MSRDGEIDSTFDVSCAPIRLLLPWFVNDTATPTECVAVTAHLAVCLTCRDVAENWRRIATLVHAAVDAEEPPPGSLELLLLGLRARLSSTDGPTQTSGLAPLPTPQAVEMLSPAVQDTLVREIQSIARVRARLAYPSFPPSGD